MDEKHEETSSEEITSDQRTLQQKFNRLEKENQSLTSYNSDLRDQVKLMNAKLNLAKNYLFSSAAVQTDIHIPKNEVNNQVFSKCTMLDAITSSDKKSDLDSFLNDIKTANADYEYDAVSKTYYSRSTGWYYYQESSAFYNPANQSYYRYDLTTKEYQFLYKIGDKQKAEKSESTKKTSQTAADVDVEMISSSSEEEGEIIEVSDGSLSPEHKTRNHIIESKAVLRKTALEERPPARRLNRSSFNKIAPVRLIVQSADQLDIGSLLLVSCMGGKIGQHPNCAVTIPDSTISQLHAEITYDHQLQQYVITDLCSRNGTFVNDSKLKPLCRNALFHGDILRFSDTVQMLAHIHQHRDTTCADCEASLVDTKKTTGIYQTEGGTSSVRQLQKSLKRHYGLAGEEYRENIGPELPPGYRDRAAQRQREMGSDNPYEKTAAGSALDV